MIPAFVLSTHPTPDLGKGMHLFFPFFELHQHKIDWQFSDITCSNTCDVSACGTFNFLMMHHLF